MNKGLGVAIAYLLLLLPIALIAILVPFFQTALVLTFSFVGFVFFGGTLAAFALCILTLTQVQPVLTLIDEGIAVRGEVQE